MSSPGYEESLPPKETADEILNLFTDTLDSVDLVTDDPKSKELAQKLSEEYQELLSVNSTSWQIRSREVRPTDYVRHGEHPGVRIIIDYPEDVRVEINIKGGIRDPKAQTEFTETATRAILGKTHEERTLGLGDKATELNLQRKVGGKVKSEVWIKDTPGSRPSVAVTTLRNLNEEMQNFDKIDRPIVFGLSTYQYNELHTRIRGNVAKLLKFLP